MGAVVAAALLVPAAASGQDYGRWQLTLSGEIHQQWTSTDTSPCAITGHGSGDLRFDTPAPVTFRLRRLPPTSRYPVIWEPGPYPGAPVHFRVRASGSTSASAVQQPSASPERSCLDEGAWPDPQTWSCGPFAYFAQSQIQVASLLKPHHPAGFQVTGSDIEPGNHQHPMGCFYLYDLDYTIGGDGPMGKPLFFLLPTPARLARRHRIVVPDQASLTASELPFFARFQRSATLVLTRIS